MLSVVGILINCIIVFKSLTNDKNRNRIVEIQLHGCIPKIFQVLLIMVKDKEIRIRLIIWVDLPGVTGTHWWPGSPFKKRSVNWQYQIERSKIETYVDRNATKRE